MFRDECLRELVQGEVVNLSVYYRHQSAWWNTESKRLDGKSTPPLLDKALTGARPVRAKRSPLSYFPVADLGAVVEVEFRSATTAPRREAFQKKLEKLLENATNAFRVRHSPLTGLLQKDPFIEAVSRALQHLSEQPQLSTTKGEGLPPPAVCVIAIDIDHFKQANDNYGHLYGDLVLKSLALRIDRTATSFRQGRSSQLEILTAHASGEEFFCLLSGAVETSTFQHFAEDLRKAVSDVELPNDTELTIFRPQLSELNLTIPPATSRRITISLGVAIEGEPRTGRDYRQAALALIDRADTALYKSKGSGRNRQTLFTDILSKEGRVLEHRPEVNLVVVDIGSSVGVARGQEFRVFPPDFCGEVPFCLDDGRTRRVLGRYPRLEIAQVVAFDVQKQVSFCTVTEPETAGLSIPPSSRLEAIPLGAISPVVSRGVRGRDYSATLDQSVRLCNHAESEKFFGEYEGDDSTGTLVVRIFNESDLLESHGTVFVNRALSNLLSLARTRIHGAVFFGVVDVTKLAISIGVADFDVFRLNVTSLLGEASALTGDAAQFCAGVFAARAYARLPRGDTSEPRKSKRLEMARYAASDEAKVTSGAVNVFGTTSALDILDTWRTRREPLKGLADYQRLRECGVLASAVERVAGQLYADTEDFAAAELNFRKAIELDPENSLAKLSLTLALRRQGSAEKLEIHLKAFNLDEIRAAPHLYSTDVMAIALAAHWLGKNGQIDLDKATDWLEVARDQMDDTESKQVFDVLLSDLVHPALPDVTRT